MLACEQREVQDEKPIAAQVYTKTLLEEEVLKNIPELSSPEDSTRLFNNFVDRWVRREIYLHEAEKEVNQSIEIDKLVKDYKESLIIHHFENYISEKYLDTFISLEELLYTYNEEKELFLLSEPVYQLLAIKVDPTEVEVIQNLQKALASSVISVDLTEIMKTDTVYTDTLWLMEKDLVEKKKQAGLDSLENEKMIFLDNCNGKMCIHSVIDKKEKDQLAPFSLAVRDIRAYIYHKRKQEIISNIKEELYYKALDQNKIKISFKK